MKQDASLLDFIKKEIKKRYQSEEYQELKARLEEELLVPIRSEEEKISNIDLYINKKTIIEIDKKCGSIANIRNAHQQSVDHSQKQKIINEENEQSGKYRSKPKFFQLRVETLVEVQFVQCSQVPIKVLEPEFVQHHQINFKTQLIRSNLDEDMQKRAQMIAKLQILQLYKNKSPLEEQTVLVPDSLNQPIISEDDVNKLQSQPEVRKRKKSQLSTVSNWQDQTAGQAKLMAERITNHMNRMTNQHFTNKKYDEAIKMKKSLQKFQAVVESMPSDVDRLRYMIKYKDNRGY